MSYDWTGLLSSILLNMVVWLPVLIYCGSSCILFYTGVKVAFCKKLNMVANTYNNSVDSFVRKFIFIRTYHTFMFKHAKYSFTWLTIFAIICIFMQENKLFVKGTGFHIIEYPSTPMFFVLLYHGLYMPPSEFKKYKQIFYPFERGL